jgi:hypothetical protein
MRLQIGGSTGFKLTSGYRNLTFRSGDPKAVAISAASKQARQAT